MMFIRLNKWLAKLVMYDREHTDNYNATLRKLKWLYKEFTMEERNDIERYYSL